MLHLAVMTGNIELVRTLLEAGADTRIQDVDSLTAADVAVRYHYCDIAQLCQSSPTNKIRRERQIRKPQNSDNNNDHGDDNSNVSDPSIEHIEQVIRRRQLERQESRLKHLEEERKFQEEVDLERSIYDETIWALTLERNLAEEADDDRKISWCDERIQEEQSKKDNVYINKQTEWRERKRKAEEFQELLNLRQRTKRRNREVKHNPDDKKSEKEDIRSGDNIVENNNDQVVHLEQVHVCQNSTKKETIETKVISNNVQKDQSSSNVLSSFTKFAIIGGISGLLLRYLLLD